MNKIANKFHAQIDALIALNHEYRQELPEDIKQSFLPAEFAREFCTVKCDIGRSTGKTEYVKIRADSKTLVVVPNRMLAKTHRETKADVLTAEQVAKAKAIPAYEMIYIEEPTFVFRRVSVYVIYQQLAREGVDQTFVQIGI